VSQQNVSTPFPLPQTPTPNTSSNLLQHADEAVIEIWSDRIGQPEFHGSYDKRHAWWRVLEARSKRFVRSRACGI